MASPPVNEKVGMLAITTTAITTDGKSGATTTTTTGTLNPRGEVEYSRLSGTSTPTTSHLDLSPFDTDVEAMMSTLTTRDDCGMKSASAGNMKGSPDGQVWPGKDHWKKKAKAARVNQRSCQYLAKMSKRNRIIVRVLIILVVVAVGVGVGVGISRATGASIWKPDSGN